MGGSRQTVLYLLFNFASAVGVIFLNKLIFRRVTFVYPTCLSLIHYAITFMGLEILRRMGIFQEQKQRPMNRMLWILAVMVGIAPPINNLSLKLNNMGFYTLMKLLVTPMIVVMEYVFEYRLISIQRGLSLIAVAIGVGIASISDVQLQLIGLLTSLVWLPVAAVYKVFWSRAQKEEGWQTLPLMYRIIPYSMVFQMMMMPLTDPPDILSYTWSTESVFLILLSGLSAFAVNFSGFLVLGLCSPLTHVVLGQVKSATLVLGGFLLFGHKTSEREIFGSSIAILASGTYGFFTSAETPKVKGARMTLPKTLLFFWSEARPV